MGVTTKQEFQKLKLGLQLDTRGAFAQALRDVINLNKVVQLALEHLRNFFRGADLTLSLISTKENQLVPIWANNKGELCSQFLRKEGPLWDIAIKTFKSQDRRFPLDIYATLIEIEEAPIGVLVMRNGDEDMVELVDYVAQELVQTASQMEEISEVYQLSRELAILNQIGKSLTAYTELDNILVATMQGIWELFQVEVASLILLDFDKENMLIKIPLTGEPDHVKRFDAGEMRGIVGNCITQRAIALVEDISLESMFDPMMDGVEGFSTKSLLCVPLLVRNRAMGAISLINNIDGPFEKRDVDMLVTLAASVAVAVANASLIHEITAANIDLQESRREIERSRSTLLALFDNLDDELYIIDRNYTVIAVNRSRAERVGVEPRKLVGKLCYQVLEAQSEPCLGCRAQETFEKQKKTNRTERMRESDGQAVEREIYTYPILDAEGNVSQTILQLRDVTDQRRLEASLVQAEKLAALGQLAAGVAHELNNPITAVIANTQLLQRELDPIRVDMESVELIEQAGKRAQRVVRALLDFARQEAEEFHLVDVNHTIQQALSLVERQWKRANVELVRDLSPGQLEVDGNADYLQGVWLNLLVNAYDALEGKPGKVIVQSRKQGGSIVVRVEDNGVGIAPEDMKRIFEPFFTTKAPGKGTGLGLATSFRIIEQHQGKIEVDSSPGGGTLFTVRLPIPKK
jgi:two-component system NtrC family sensor kinase